MRVRSFSLLAAATLLTPLAFGCASAANSSNGSWIGRSRAELMQSKGRPTRTYSDGAGGTVLIYAHPIPLAPAAGDDSGSLRATPTLTSYEEFLVDGKGVVTDRSIGVIPAPVNPFD